MDGTLRSQRLLAVVLLLVCALPARVDAQHFVCRPIAAGDTATDLARRLTGKSETAYAHAFQIRDPVRRMFVPKSQYRRLQSDWQACVAREPVGSTPVAYAPVVAVVASPIVRGEPIIAAAVQPIDAAPVALAGADRTVFNGRDGVTIGAAMLSILLLALVAGSLAPRPIPPAVLRAGENFVTVFARPLVDASPGGPSIQTRLRFLRRQQQLEIFIAPGPGHRYPNLTDHKKNVEYDVDRVMRILGNYVLSRPPRAVGKWIVVTISPAETGDRVRSPAARVLGVSKPSELHE